MKVVIEFTDGRKEVKDFGQDITGAFRYQAGFVRKKNVKYAGYEQ